MRRFLMILEGPTPGTAEPIFATEDEDLIEMVAAHMRSRLVGAHLHAPTIEDRVDPLAGGASHD